MPKEIINSAATTRVQPLLRVEKLGKTYINPTGFLNVRKWLPLMTFHLV